MLKPPKENPKNTNSQLKEDSVRKAVYADFRDNAIGKAFVKLTNWYKGESKFIYLSNADKLELIKRKYPEPMKVKINLKKEATIQKHAFEEINE